MLICEYINYFQNLVGLLRLSMRTSASCSAYLLWVCSSVLCLAGCDILRLCYLGLGAACTLWHIVACCSFGFCVWIVVYVARGTRHGWGMGCGALHMVWFWMGVGFVLAMPFWPWCRVGWGVDGGV